MHSTKRLWTPEARARKHLKLGPNTILAIMRHGCSILTATISRSFIKAKLIGGNDGLVDTEGNLPLVSLRVHQPLEIAKGAIPTFPPPRRRSRWKSGNPKAGFPLSHRPEDVYRKQEKGGLAADRCAPAFRLILRENQTPVQAHSSMRICFRDRGIRMGDRAPCGAVGDGARGCGAGAVQRGGPDGRSRISGGGDRGSDGHGGDCRCRRVPRPGGGGPGA